MNRTIAYHCTNAEPSLLVNGGFQDGNGGYTEDNQFEVLYDKYLPEVPCFVSKRPWDTDSKYVLKIDITGLDLYPDFGHLLDFNAYYEEPDANGDTLFWWESKEYGDGWSLLNSVPELKKFLRKNDGYLPSQYFSGEDSWKFIGTACIDGKELTEDRILNVSVNESTDSLPYIIQANSERQRRKEILGRFSFDRTKEQGLLKSEFVSDIRVSVGTHDFDGLDAICYETKSPKKKIWIRFEFLKSDVRHFIDDYVVSRIQKVISQKYPFFEYSGQRDVGDALRIYFSSADSILMDEFSSSAKMKVTQGTFL